jgi:hypothetical protein
MITYQQFLESKRVEDAPTGLEVIPPLGDHLYPFQRDIVSWALRRGRAAIFADCGMGKTAMQLEWARHIPGRVLIVAPLAVAQQTEREGDKFGVGVEYAREDTSFARIVTNYDMLHKFNPDNFAGIILDESSIIKNETGKFRNSLIANWGRVPFRLCCTATPAPNDFMELGNHAEFLGVMTRTEMLAQYFVHDGGETQKWRLKGHAEGVFWRWLASWAVMIRKPSDLGYEDGAFQLPGCRIIQHQVQAKTAFGEFLFPVDARTLQERLAARRDTLQERCEAAAALVNASKEPWLVWCGLNPEADLLTKLIPGAVNVQGKDKREVKEQAMLDFVGGRTRVLVSKPSICGFGLNFQHCHNMAFVGLSDSYEQFYQALRRCWRFGQTREVQAHVITADIEGAVVANIQRKEADSERMAVEMVRHMQDINSANIRQTTTVDRSYRADSIIQLPSFLQAA